MSDSHPSVRRSVNLLLRAQREALRDEVRWMALSDEIARRRAEIASTPASTPAGVAEQIRLAVECRANGSTLGEIEETALHNALMALERMARTLAALLCPALVAACGIIT